ncbi:MAG: type II toxin-antitoxin system VapC family toxin [Acidobacteriota bacterium]|nr:type II toxin-antitoxin system VapC family toxin [Acidobacteriota bacterium]
MVLVDTSVWVAHFRDDLPSLRERLHKGDVVCHPMIIGELACGNFKNRKEILGLLAELHSAEVAGHDEVMALIETHRLMGKGLGYIDMHLLASALLSGCSLWTQDRKLSAAAESLDIPCQ